MSHVDVTKDELRRQTWAHDERAIAEAIRLFDEDPVKNFSTYVTTMYSFRDKPECCARLLLERRMLVQRLTMLMNHPNEPNPKKWADRIDTFSTQLYWISQQPQLEMVEATAMREVAQQAVRMGLAHTRKEERGGHTHTLLQLTYAAMLLDTGDDDDHDYAQIHLRTLYGRGIDIIDTNQKRRVFKKLVVLAKQAGMPILALKALARLLFV